MRVPFDMKYRPQIESGEYKVETRDGKPAKIVYWDLKAYDDDIKLVVIIGEDGSQGAITMSKHGSFYSDYLALGEHRYDLFIVTPEPELTEFEGALSKFLCDASVRPGPENYDAWAREYASQLLDLAKKELKSPWIPASNPPDDDRLVFICVNDNGIVQCVGCGCYKQGVWVDAEDKLDYPDYWIEIPELPKEK